jgi:phosphinothricin acetyltransferase
MSVNIRWAERQDVPGILEIYNEAVLNTTATADYEPQTLDKRLEWFDIRESGGYPILVAEERGRIVGWSSLSPYHSRPGYRFSAEISVYVAADWRGQGIGKLLLPPLLEAGIARGLHAIVASIDSENEASIRLHAAHGFDMKCRLNQLIYKFDRWLDVVYMEKILSTDDTD